MKAGLLASLLMAKALISERVLDASGNEFGEVLSQLGVFHIYVSSQDSACSEYVIDVLDITVELLFGSCRKPIAIVITCFVRLGCAAFP